MDESNSTICSQQETIVGQSFAIITKENSDIAFEFFDKSGEPIYHLGFMGSFQKSKVSGWTGKELISLLSGNDAFRFKNGQFIINLQDLYSVKPDIESLFNDGGYLTIVHSENLEDAVYFKDKCLVGKNSLGITKLKNKLRMEKEAVNSFKMIENRPFNIDSDERLLPVRESGNFAGITVYNGETQILSYNVEELIDKKIITSLTDYYVINPERLKSEPFWGQDDTVVLFADYSSEFGNSYDFTGPNLEKVKLTMQSIEKNLGQW